jgi:hypothetical protein
MRDDTDHLVCGDCPAELRSDSQRAAARLAADHETVAGHDVAVSRGE